jgi:pimeloyl-ACP methyl ester carboxylesterase
MPSVRVRDIDLYYRESGPKDGEPLVLLHGFTATGHMFDAFSEDLGQHYRLYAVDLRGHGRTLNPQNEISHADLALDIVVFLEVTGLRKAHFCGVSTGGMLLTFIALEHPELILSLTYAASTYTFDEHVKEQARIVASTTPDQWYTSLERSHAEFQGAGYSRTVINLWKDSVLHPNELPFTPEDLSQISCPTLIIHGDRDQFFPLHVPLTMYQSIPNAELCVIPNCGHSITRENPKMFVSALLGFLDKLSLGGESGPMD